MPSKIDQIIRGRRTVSPDLFNNKEIGQDLLLEILENANWAPSHKKTEPWRFKIFKGDARQTLEDYLANAYKAGVSAENFSEIRMKKISEKATQANVAIAVCMQREAEESLPEWEEIAAVACAVQNIWLTCTAHGIGMFWATPSFILKANDFLGLARGERCLGLLYLGYYDTNVPMTSSRKPISDKIKFM